MIQVRRSKDRGHAQHGWLFAKHSFSFGDYYDDHHLGFRDLRVINEDQIQGGGGFPMHPHRSMEILTYMLDGQLEHQDSLGNHGVIGPGEVQYMSAGSGVVHSEFNHSKTEIAHLLQIWILPEQQGGAPNYGQKKFPVSERKNKFCLLASSDGRENSIVICQDTSVFVSLLDAGNVLVYPGSTRNRYFWIQVAKGEIEIFGETLCAGDGLSITPSPASSEKTPPEFKITARQDSEFLLFDLK